MSTGNISNNDQIKIISSKDAMSLSEMAEVLGMTNEEIAALTGNTGGNIPSDWDGDMSDEEILAMLREDTSENAHD